MWIGSRLCLHALKWRVRSRWYWGPGVCHVPMTTSWDLLGPQQKRASLAQCLQRPDVLYKCGDVSHCPSGEVSWWSPLVTAPEPHSAVKLESGLAQWRSYKMVAPRKPLSNPTGVNPRTLPVSIYTQKNPLTDKFLWSNSDILWVNFKCALYGNVHSCLLWNHQSEFKRHPQPSAQHITRPDSKITDGWQNCS